MGSLSTAWTHIRRSPYQAFSVIFIMLQTFFVVSIFTIVIVASSRIIDYFEAAPQVTAFFKNEAKQENMDALQEEIKASGKVAAIEFFSKQDSFRLFKEQNKEDELLLSIISADVLPAGLKISAVEIEDLTSISDMVAKNPFVDKVIFQKDIVKTLMDWTSALRKIGVAIIAILALDAIFLMVIITGIRISQKREEIEIMRLIGATNWYIRKPFMLEGMFYGVVGAVIGWAIAIGLLISATPALQSYLGNIPALPLSYSFLFGLLGGEVLLAVFLGVFASYIAVLRYLK